MVVRQELDGSLTDGELEAIERIAELSVKQVKRAQRDQHPKQHGCVWAEFEVLDNLPETLRAGIFAQPHTFKAWVRFSNASEQNDAKGDLLYGMAIKLMQVQGQKILTGEQSAEGQGATTQDFVMATMPAFFVKNINDYRELLEKQEKFGVPMAFLWFVICGGNPLQWRWQEGKILLSLIQRKICRKPVSPLEEVYWSSTPYRLGQQVIKFYVKPDPANLSGRKPGKAENYLREAMTEHLAQRDAYFDFFVQLQDPKNLDRTPMDDPRIEWKDGEEYRVARIKIPCQKFDAPEQMEFGEHLSFTPWHCLYDHEPVGSINRARKESYQSTSKQRHQLNGVTRYEPSPDTFPPHVLSSSFMQYQPVQQHPLTMIVKIQSGRERELENLLEKTVFNSEKGREVNEVRSLLSRSQLTHFARFVILQDSAQGLEPHLLFSSNYDGDFENYIQELITLMGYKLDEIFSHCEGYDPESKDALNASRLTNFINRHSFQNPQEVFFYAACPRLSVVAIQNNLQIYQRLTNLFKGLNQPELKDIQQTLKTLYYRPELEDIRQALQTLQDHLDLKDIRKNLQELYDRLIQPEKSAAPPIKKSGLKQWIASINQHIIDFGLDIARIRIGLKSDVIPNPAKLAELNERDRSIQDYLHEKYKKLQALEDRISQNQITVLTPIKTEEVFYKVESDYYYRALVKFILKGVVNDAKKNLTPLTTIHFARWVVVDLPTTAPDKSQRMKSFLLFESNYDGAFDSYIDAFVKALGNGMDLIWGNCFEFPENGVQDIEWFKYYIRKYQFPSQVFHSAYPYTSIGQIQRDRDLAQRVMQWMKNSMSVMNL